jgi:hypothetical protein
MPFLFEPIADYTELLLPEDLLSPDSILAKLRAVMTEDVCEDVEIIGWLYQFYNSELKDQVFAALKKNQKITAENIPAATQLFTPHWIVRYLIENSLGRLWLLNRPQSRLAERMDYYVAPEEFETDFLPISSPEDIRICDPACGSGHMLTYAFDLLYAIYEEEGYAQPYRRGGRRSCGGACGLCASNEGRSAIGSATIPPDGGAARDRGSAKRELHSHRASGRGHRRWA